MSSAPLELAFSSQCVVCFPSNRSSNVKARKSIMQFRCCFRNKDKLKVYSSETDREKSWPNNALGLFKRQLVRDKAQAIGLECKDPSKMSPSLVHDTHSPMRHTHLSVRHSFVCEIPALVHETPTIVCETSTLVCETHSSMRHTCP